MKRRDMGIVESIRKYPMSIVLMFVGAILMGAASGYGPAAVSEPLEITLFGPEVFGKYLGQWIFTGAGVAVLLAGLKTFTFSREL
jgi:hypothetical protein